MSDTTHNHPSFPEISDTDEAARRKEFYRRSLDYFMLMVKAQPINVPAWGHIGILLYELGRFDEAQDYFKKIIDHEPENSVAWDALGFIKMERGDFDGAAQAFERVLFLSPRRSDVAADMALCLLNAGRPESARDALTEKVGRAMGTKEHYLMGQIAGRLGGDPADHYRAALAAYRAPDGPVREGVYASLAAMRGVILSQSGEKDAARLAFIEAGERASQTDPDRMILSAKDLTFKIRGSFIREVRELAGTTT